MAITLYQNYPTVVHSAHQWANPEYYTCASSVYSTYDDFKYKFELNTSDGIESISKNSPAITNGLGIYNPNKYLKNLLKIDGDFQPDITTWRAPEDQLVNYRVDISEYSSSLSSPSSRSFQKNTVLNATKNNFDFNDYILGGSNRRQQGLALSNQSAAQTIEFNLDSDEGTIRFLVGKQKPQSSGTVNVGYNSLLYEILLTVTKASGDVYYYTTNTKYPYWITWCWNGMTTDNNILQDLTGMVIDFPTAPKQLNQVSWTQVGEQLVGGTYTNTNINIGTGLGLEVGDTYTINAYCWPYGVNGKTSIDYNFEVVRRCDHRTNIELAWLNKVGGFDYYVCTMNTQKKISDNKQTYQKNRDRQGYNGNNNYIGHTEYDRGDAVYYNEIRTTYDVNTDWLSDTEVLYLEDMWNSREVFAKVDDTWYPIIINLDSQDIETDYNYLRQYNFSFTIANKNYD